ncbi:uncharacterized protein C8Q71DRAFT_824710 [Rhodofomes roseus]|uniref:RRM domain-containing protein n=1 Tax=Rhodofomes roseus TaxID=34475 RepID=A0ABQ8K1N2_9APHY|nr:uncharacterized protein C8Q71DRAFT_824710 [Rhodofomes roseus]KAH9830589.1 hypothetical protein C8Q71DRAFT_824710 [Rhodofomes roseus]
MSKVVFVGNIPYTIGEEQLIDVFKTVGSVVGFRLVYDRDTGKPRGYGFCEFSDHETAESAVRNLNGHDLGGRPLRIDLADSDPFLEGKTTVRGELLDGGETRAQWRERNDRDRDRDPNAFLQNLPQGVPIQPGSTALDTISQMLATTNPAQIIEVLAQMKAFVITHPDQARALLVAHPQFGYALFQALLLNNIVDPAILQRMLQATNSATPSQAKAPAPVAPPPMHQPTPQHQPQPQHPPPLSASYSQGPLPSHPSFPPHLAQNIPQTHTPVHHPTPPIPPPSMFPPPSAHLSHTQAQAPPYYRPPPPPSMPPPVSQAHPAQPPANQAAAPALDPAQRDMLMQVLSLTQDQINSLPPAEREQIQQLRKQFGIAV